MAALVPPSIFSLKSLMPPLNNGTAKRNNTALTPRSTRFQSRRREPCSGRRKHQDQRPDDGIRVQGTRREAVQDEQSLHVDHTEGAQQDRRDSPGLLSQARSYKEEAEKYRGWKGVADYTVTRERTTGNVCASSVSRQHLESMYCAPRTCSLAARIAESSANVLHSGIDDCKRRRRVRHAS